MNRLAISLLTLGLSLGPILTGCNPGPKAEPNSEQAKAIAEIEKVGGTVIVDQSTQVIVYLRGIPKTDAGLEYLKGLTNLQQLYLAENGVGKITDAGLENLKGLTNLQNLGVAGTQVTDAGLEHLEGLTRLMMLDLGGTNVTDAGLEHLKGLTQLQWLQLASTHVAGTGLEQLNGLTKLVQLDLSITPVTDAGVSGLQKSLPNCRIRH